ncbi:MAG: hypothetical protein GEU90_21565 [Gemmatimonas sp.]|nr:hypothetical protein [Gemmatimonas sp.]
MTRDTIRVTVWTPLEGFDRLLDMFATHFNNRFQFYGRKLVLSHHPLGWFGDTASDVTRAVEMDETDKSFAGVTPPGQSRFYKEVARRHLILTMVSWVTNVVHTEKELAKWHPYTWQYTMAGDRYLSNIGEWICKRIAGKRAKYARSPLNSQKRRFAVHLQKTPFAGESAGTGSLRAALSRCGATPKRTSVNDSGGGFAGSFTEAQADTEITRMRRAKVNSVICICPWYEESMLTNAANRAGYVPEWITTAHHPPWSGVPASFPSPNGDRRFGLLPNPMHVPLQREPGFQALRDAGGRATGADMTVWAGTGHDAHTALRMYRQMLLLASGIQMAGPKLNPQTFGAGLQRTRFPNPPDPRRPGKVGFIDGDHSMINDAAQVYWDRKTRGHYVDESGGTTCFLERGKRYKLGRWGKARGAFFTRPPCFNGSV